MSVQALPAGTVKASPVPVTLTEKDLKTIDRITGINIIVAILALSIGALLGVFQGLEHSKVLDIYPFLQPVIKTYYQGLTLHGALNAITWTTFFICGFFTFAVPRSFNRPLRYPWMSWLALGLMVVGLVTAAIPMLLNNASVLYTFYPPMLADVWFYVGLTVLVIGSWFVGYSIYFTYYAWRKENPEARAPFIALTSTITMVLWQLATLGVAAEILFQLIPLSLGLIPGTDVLLDRTLFWWFGHPLVYFWLLPAYVSWYAMLPAQTNGKMFSESLGRLVFWLFLIFSTPVGFHHQFADPGIPQVWKFIHMLLTMGVGFPSLITAFTVVASLEIGARARGGKGYLAWIGRLNWGDPSYAGQNLAMILFIFGGIGGMINASYTVNMAMHNTMWVPGHFHLTVGSATTLTFMAITYWLVPKLTGHKLFTKWLALAQVWTWFFGMLFFSNAYHTLGLIFSVPRRTMLGQAPYYSTQWTPQMMESVLGLMFLSISATLFFAIMILTVVIPRKPDKPVEMPVAEPLDPKPSPKWLDTWWPWLNGAIALVILSYGPMLFQMISNMTLWARGMRVW